MTRRPGVTLMEVLIAMFIMAIGMLALLVLFPVGAVSMAQALKDDRCAYASTVSENTAIVSNIRYGDLTVTTQLNAALAASLTGLGMVYVDPYGFHYGLNALPLGGPLIVPPIQRVSPSFITTIPPTAPPVLPTQLCDRWFSLPDDIGYNLSGYPDPPFVGGIDRGRRYSFAYLLRKQLSLQATPTLLANATNATQIPVQLYAVVYSGRPIFSLATTPGEYYLPLVAPITPATAVFPNSVTLLGTGLQGLKRGGWVFEPYNGYFYRVTNIAENTLANTTTVEFQQNLRWASPNPIPIPAIVGMDYVAEVFDKGTGWQQ
jgi:prepilin-type N-terminal cleavage/methylation domain-containing protein